MRGSRTGRCAESRSPRVTTTRPTGSARSSTTSAGSTTKPATSSLRWMHSSARFEHASAIRATRPPSRSRATRSARRYARSDARSEADSTSRAGRRLGDARIRARRLVPRGARRGVRRGRPFRGCARAGSARDPLARGRRSVLHERHRTRRAPAPPRRQLAPQSGMLPCLRFGVGSRFESAVSSAEIRTGRVRRGWMTSST